MHHNRNEKLNQVTERTLVVGIDIAKRTHYACAVDNRGRELGKAFSVDQSRAGFLAFRDKLAQLLKRFDKQEILIGFEPTGHYWMNLAAFLTDNEIRFVIVNPMHVSRTKELDDNLQTKNDQKDARVIAKLMTNGNFSYPRRLAGVDAELRQGAAFRLNLKKDIATVKNRVKRWLDRYFPEFTLLYKDLGQNACAILRQTPLPADLVGQEIESLVTLYRDREGLCYPSRPKLKQLQTAAEQSIGLTEGTTMARVEIRAMITQYLLLDHQLDEVNTVLETLAKQLTDYDPLISIPGIGEQTVTQLLAETGSLKRYRHPRQLIKLAGLTLRENSSGQKKGQKHVSKRGRKKLRALLYRAVLPLVRNNPVFKELYHYYIERPDNPLKKKEALVVLCGKLIKVFHGLVKTGTPFDAARMRKDLTCLE